MLGSLVVLCSTCTEARGDIYSYTEESGTPSFSNVPADPRYVLTIRTEQPKELQKFVVHRIDRFNRVQQRAYMPEITTAASAYHLDPALLHAVIATESGYDASAVSVKGAIGLMQLMPETARRYGATDPFDPGQNVRAGAQHLSRLLLRFDNDLYLALAAYNSGEVNVVKYGERIPPFPETVAYVPKVIGLYRKYQQEIRK